MESKLNLKAIKAYSDAFAAVVADQAFAHQDKTGGKEIMSLTPVRQINLFVINDLLNKWKTETQKIRSPYFDFESPEVKEALLEFMNILSQHIAVDRGHLLPLLENATQNTLLLLLDPHYFYYQVLSDVQYSLTQENLKELFKYVKINRSFPDLLLQHLQRENKNEIHASYALWLLDEKAEQVSQHQEDIAGVLHEFSKIKPVNQNTFNNQHAAAPSPSTYQENRESNSEEIEEGPKTLNDFLNVKKTGANLADIHLKKKIDNLRNHISVNQRYMFIRELFDNNHEEYHRALGELEQHNTYVDAFNYLRHEYASKHRWRMDSEEVVEFLEIISKRYS